MFALLWCLLALEQPSNADRVVEEAARQIEAHNFQEAFATLGAATRRYSDDARLWNLFGIVRGELGQLEPAREAFERGLKLLPGDVALNENLGFLFYREKRFAEAERTLAKAVLLGSHNPGVAFSLAVARVRLGEREQGRLELIGLETALASFADYWVERGLAELPSAPAAAEASFDRALTIAPDEMRALNGAASAAELQNADEKALSFLVRAKQAHPDDVETLLHFSVVCLRRDLTLDAVAAAERSHQLAPENLLALFVDARAQIGVQQWQKSYDLFSEFARRRPTYAPTYYALGWLDLKLNRPDDARKQLERCVALAPKFVDALQELAQLRVEDGDVDGGEKLVKAALDREPGHVASHVTYGDILLKRGKAGEAVKQYQAAVQGNAESGPAHFKLSVALLRLNRTEEAQSERALGVELNQKALRESKVVMRLAAPDGTLLSASP